MWFCSWVSPKGLTPMGIPNHHISQDLFPFSSHVELSSPLIPLTISTSNKGPHHIEPPSNDTCIPCPLRWTTRLMWTRSLSFETRAPRHLFRPGALLQTPFELATADPCGNGDRKLY